MNDKRLTKQYGKLTPRERAVLVINAFGRRDDAQWRQLLDASPRVTFTAPDSSPYHWLFVDAIARHALKQTEYVLGLFYLLWRAERVEWNDDETSLYADVMLAARSIVARADGWKVFCNERGLDPVGALKIAGADGLLLGMAEEIAQKIVTRLPAMGEDTRKMLADAGIEHAEQALITAEQVAAEYREFC